MKPRRLIAGSVLGCVLFAITVALLAFAAAWTPEGSPRCFVDFAHARFPDWLGCALATHETLAGGLIAAGGALFGAWLAFSGLEEQIGMARLNELEAKRLALERLVQDAGRDVDLMVGAHGFTKGIGDQFPEPGAPGVNMGAFAAKLLEIRQRGGLRISPNAGRAPDGNGGSIETVVGRLRDLADHLYEETRQLPADQKGATLRARDSVVIEQVQAVRDLAALLEGKLPRYKEKFETAVAQLHGA
jgi:hypothetical protein